MAQTRLVNNELFASIRAASGFGTVWPCVLISQENCRHFL